ncbi:MAG TPA: YicC/YloC family endoribonuclease [Xanthobacteraceae bacterium]|nr:YicC/YloC family endoribonuclease [Xanthobacteraceae bacterium]
MALSSMTGFARRHGVCGSYAWAWEIKSVNGKGLDIRLRLPPGWDAIEAGLRSRAAETLARGSIQTSLTVERHGVVPAVQVNTAVVEALVTAARQLARRIEASPPTLDGLLGLKGVIDIGEATENEEERRGAEEAVKAGFAEALAALADMRRHEGAALARVLGSRLDEISALTQRAELAPGRRPEAVRARLAEQIATLLAQSERFDPDRLHQEAILIATKADVREELDRLAAHVAQAKGLIEQGGPIGRRLDFLAQELNREANTLCAKANDLELTNIGMELKAAVEQFREQVQNVE